MYEAPKFLIGTKFENWTKSKQSNFLKKLRKVRREKLHKLSEAQNHRCCYCGCHTWSTLKNKLESQTRGQLATLEHIVTIINGGTDSYSNLVMSCYDCNSKRNVSDPFKYHELVKTPELKQAFLQQCADFKRQRNQEKKYDKKIRFAEIRLIDRKCFEIRHMVNAFSFFNLFFDIKNREIITDLNQ